MAAYNLQLYFSMAELSTISQAGESIVVSRALSGSNSNVAWLSFAPLQLNVVSWDNDYGLYASEALSSGNVRVLSATATGGPSGRYWNFTNGSFAGPFTGKNAPAPGSYRVFNQTTTSPSFGFGLLQGATVNSLAVPPNPANTEIVLANQFATFTPLNAVYVWLQSNVQRGDILQVPPPAGIATATFAASGFSTLVQFQDPSTLTYQYDAASGAFVSSS